MQTSHQTVLRGNVNIQMQTGHHEKLLSKNWEISAKTAAESAGKKSQDISIFSKNFRFNAINL